MGLEYIMTPKVALWTVMKAEAAASMRAWKAFDRDAKRQNEVQPYLGPIYITRLLTPAR
jgi:hypothetical protein